MNIKGIKGMSVLDIQNEVAVGGRFVRFSYCISVVVISFRLSSPVYFLKRQDNAFAKGIPFSLLSFLVGWWGIPWGLVYTPVSIFTNLRGGKDVTEDMLKILHRHTEGHVFDFEKPAVFELKN